MRLIWITTERFISWTKEKWCFHPDMTKSKRQMKKRNRHLQYHLNSKGFFHLTKEKSGYELLSYPIFSPSFWNITISSPSISTTLPCQEQSQTLHLCSASCPLLCSLHTSSFNDISFLFSVHSNRSSLSAPSFPPTSTLKIPLHLFLKVKILH